VFVAPVHLTQSPLLFEKSCSRACCANIVHHLLFFLPYITHIQKIQEYCTFYNGRLYIFRMITSERDQKQFDEITSDLEELTQDATLSLSLGEMLTP